MNNNNISSNWNSFKKIWIIIAILLFISLVVLWLLGFGPWGNKCVVEPKVIEKIVEVEKIVDNPKLLSRISTLEKDNIRIAGLMTTIDGLKKDNSQISELSSKIKSLKDENIQISDLRKKLELFKTDNALIDGLKTKIADLEGANSHIDGLQSQIKMLKAENEKLSALKGRVNELDGANKKIAGLQEQVKNLDSLNKKVVSLEEEIKQLATKNQIIPSLQAKITALQKVKPKAIEKVIEKIIKEPAKSIPPSVPQKVIPGLSTTNIGEPSSSIIEAPTAKLYFNVGSSESPLDKSQNLPDVVSYANNNESAEIIVSGFHDSTGDLVKNQALSISRAKSVAKLLQDEGIAVNRIKIANPAQTEGSGSPAEARRVEVRLVN